MNVPACEALRSYGFSLEVFTNLMSDATGSLRRELTAIGIEQREQDALVGRFAKSLAERWIAAAHAAWEKSATYALADLEESWDFLTRFLANDLRRPAVVLTEG